MFLYEERSVSLRETDRLSIKYNNWHNLKSRIIDRPIHRQYKVNTHSVFFGYRTHRLYAWCLRPICTVLITRMHGAYNLYARCLGEICIDTGERERSFTLYCRWIGRSSKEGETGEGCRKHTKQAFGRIKKCLSGKTCYVFCRNLLHLLLKDAMSFFERY